MAYSRYGTIATIMRHSFFLKKLVIFDIPLTFAFFNFSTPLEPFGAFRLLSAVAFSPALPFFAFEGKAASVTARRESASACIF